MCTATKDGESVSASAALTVLRPVSITEYPLYRRIIEGSTITLSVQVNGNVHIVHTHGTHGTHTLHTWYTHSTHAGNVPPHYFYKNDALTLNFSR